VEEASPIADEDKDVLSSDEEDLEEPFPKAEEVREDDLIDPVLPALGIYVVSLRRNSKHRTLHLVGACYRRPGVDYQDWLALGDSKPPASEYTSVCRQCWPRTGASDPFEAGMDREDTSSTSFGSSSDDRS